MKLNYKRTILVGFAFFLISAFWQAYDAIVPLILTNHFGLSQSLSGAVMSLDNVLAVFLLPIFGAISDKVCTKWGKRTPFVFVGTILAVVSFISLTFIDNTQYKAITDYTIDEAGYAQIETLEDEIDRVYTVSDEAEVATIANDQKAALAELVAAKDIPSQYAATDTLRDASYELISEARKAGNKELVEIAENQLDLVDKLFEGIADTTFSVTKSNAMPLVFFILMLLLVLVSMATFRSPAVALMPDVTVKPLRSKGNAIINLMGTAGGIIVLVLGMIFSTKEIYMQYTWYVVSVCAVMLAGLIVFVVSVKEKLWADQMLADTKVLEAAEASKAVAASEEKRSLSRDEFKSLLLILASVALWYIGYNSITSKYSVYATRELGFDQNLTLIIAQAAAVIAYIPVGIIASKIGRRKTILAGIVMLASAFLAGHFITPLSPEFLMYPVFVLAGIGWATINVNSFPMVVELARGGDVGKYTGYYYTASMAAQIVAPNLSGILYDAFGMRNVFFVFGTIFVALSFVTMFFVKHGDTKAERQSALEALAGAED